MQPAAEHAAVETRGLVFGLAAYGMWGLFPLYWPLLRAAGAFEIVAHRVVWSLGVVCALLAFNGGFGWLGTLRFKQAGLLALGAVFIGSNWGIYIWGVNNGHVVETSLGYFINPLVTALLGILVFGERARPAQWIGFALVLCAVLVLTVEYGRFPWLALSLATSFAAYAVLKKAAGVGALQGLALETALMFLPAAAYLLLLQRDGSGTFGRISIGHSALLVASGVVTALPLMCFAAAANRIPLISLGLLQYLAPTLQFLLGLWVFDEQMSTARWLGFALVWSGLVVVSSDAVRRHRSALAARRGVSSGTAMT